MKTDPNHKILIVCDSSKKTIPLEFLPHTDKIEYITANTGNEALEITLDTKFSLAIIETQLTELDGFETLKLLRKSNKTRMLPILFIAPEYPSIPIDEDPNNGMVDIIKLPVVAIDLKNKISLFLKINQQQQQLENETAERIKAIEALGKTKRDLLKEKEKAEQSDRMKSEFLANMSHEIRTPLNAIIGFTELFATEDLSAETKEIYRRYINRSSNLLLNLINDIIDIAKIEAGKITIEFKFENVTDIIDELEITTQNIISQRMKRDLQLVKKNFYNKKELLLFIDENRFRQVFNNLLSNAVKYTKSGTIEYGIFSSNDDEVVFYVKDTGIGIPQNKLKHIFERFGRAKVHESIQVESTGLGLFISKILVEKMCGKIWADSIEGKGSTFYFTIPVKEAPKERQDIDVQEFIKPKIPIWQQKELHILIVEDEPINFMLMNEILIKRKIKTSWAKNGMQALNFLKNKNEFDAVLMDIKMPVLNGYDVIKELRKMELNIPIIAQTAYAMSEDKKNAMQGGFDDYISKPIKSDILMKKLNHLIHI